MNSRTRSLKRLWWIIQKDLVGEYRARQAWPRMLVLGLVVAFLLSYQMTLPPELLQQVAASLCWVTICLAAVLTLGQAFASEREDGCWQALTFYPLAPETLYFAKLAVNGAILGGLQLVVVPFFALVSGAPWLSHLGPLLLVSLLGNLGICSIGTLLGAMSAGMSQHQGLLTLLLLPLLIPVMLAASEATRLLAVRPLAPEWWQWIQLLVVFVTIYATAGWLLFAFVIED
jgi:heme exporter protein B